MRIILTWCKDWRKLELGGCGHDGWVVVRDPSNSVLVKSRTLIGCADPDPGASHKCHLWVGRKLLLPLYADVRLHMPITHRTDRYSTLKAGQCPTTLSPFAAATAPATAGVGRGLITDDVSDVGSISTSDSREINLSPAQPQPSQCSWQIRGAPRFVEASCVLDRVDSFVEALPEMSKCLAKFNVSNASHPKVSRNSNRWFRCYWEMVGGGGFHPVVDYHKLIAEFERAFAVDADGCAPVVANGK